MTATLHRLRDYQAEALASLESGWERLGPVPLGIGLPTGTGKTHVMAELAAEYASKPGGVLVLVHRDQLVVQTEEKMRATVRPGSTVGVVKADRDVVGADVVVASVHTLRSARRLARIRRPSLIIVDEAHVSMSDTYVRIFAAFPDVRTAGFTATWIRSDARQLGDFWREIVYQRTIRWAIRAGHLVPPRGVAVGVPEDLLSGVGTRGGDYIASQAGEAVSVDEVRQNVVRGFHEHATGRSSVLFAPTKAAAEYFRMALADSGVPAVGVYDVTSARERRSIFSAYRRREISVLTTCTALAEGWDAPWCSAALMVRPTKHKGLYIQQVGRVLRPWPGKTDALVLDFVGGSQGMSLNLEAILRESDERDGAETDPDERDLLEPGEEQELVFRVGKGTRPVDLFAGTAVQWLTTDLGVPFVATRTRYYFLYEEAGEWSVGECPLSGLQGGRWLAQGRAAEDALNFASIVAVDDDAQTASAGADWRKDKHKPSTHQIQFARSMMCPVLPDDTRSSLADRITTQKANYALRSIGERQRTVSVG